MKGTTFSVILLLLTLSLHLSTKITHTSTNNNNNNSNSNNLISASNKSLAQSKLTTKLCNPLCKECSQNDYNFCTICELHTVFYKYTCLSRCPAGTYMDVARNCLKCNEHCPVCWGGEANMCGLETGVYSPVVALEKEIKDFLSHYTFTSREVEEWVCSLKTILSSSAETVTQVEVYETPGGNVELPVGSFAKFDGVFVPVPAYLNARRELVRSHWAYKRGMWDGKSWVKQFYPKLNMFLKTKGELSKIYFENGGHWIADPMRGWYWQRCIACNTEDGSSVEDTLNSLNSINIDLGDYARRKWRERMNARRQGVNSNIRTFFDKFLSTDRLVFNEMKHTMFEEENNFVNSLDDLKAEVHQLFGEDSIERAAGNSTFENIGHKDNSKAPSEDSYNSNRPSEKMKIVNMLDLSLHNSFSVKDA